jgi:hypothetical protein
MQVRSRGLGMSHLGCPIAMAQLPFPSAPICIPCPSPALQDDYKPAHDPVASALLEIVSIADSLSLATSDFLASQESATSQQLAADAAAQMSQRASACWLRAGCPSARRLPRAAHGLAVPRASVPPIFALCRPAGAQALQVAAQAMALASLDAIPDSERLLLQQINQHAHMVSAMASSIAGQQQG